MYQFFVPPENIQGNRVIISGEDVNHIKNVLRMRVGEEISVSNGQDGKEYRCGILELGEEILCELRFVKEDGVELPSKITLFQGLPKADKMELIIQKAVELGVYEVVPVSMKRCVVKLDDKKQKSKISRWQSIAEAAAKQSKRSIIPQVSAVMSFKQALAYAKEMDVVLVPYEMAEDMSKTREIIESIKPGQRIAFFIGPEGGFDEKEVELARQAGAVVISLGSRILRAETAAVTAVGMGMLHVEMNLDGDEQ
jgi:16S rRNA (uracil1498-N3)-methyltransferase